MSYAAEDAAYRRRFKRDAPPALLRALVQLTNAAKEGRIQDRHFWAAARAIELAELAGITYEE